MRDLARACSGPLALTSANISSQGSTLTVLVSFSSLRDGTGAAWQSQALSADLSFSSKPKVALLLCFCFILFK